MFFMFVELVDSTFNGSLIVVIYQNMASPLRVPFIKGRKFSYCTH